MNGIHSLTARAASIKNRLDLTKPNQLLYEVSPLQLAGFIFH